MKFYSAITCLICILIVASCSKDVSEKSLNNALKEDMKNLVYKPEANSTEISGLQLILIKNGDVIFEHAEGVALRNTETEIPLTVNHKVRIASISKFVLTIAFMSLVENGKVDLDADISDYLGFTLRNPNFPNRKITARQVLSHTSSIRDASYYYMGLEENFRDFFILGNNDLSHEHYEQGKHFATAPHQGPGDYFTYSNLNFGIVSGIIENVSGKRMDLFVKEQIFDPLGLKSSFSVCNLYPDHFSSLAALYRKGDQGISWAPEGPWIEQVDGNSIGCFYGSQRYSRDEIPDLSMLEEYQIGKNPTLFSPQGGLRASAKDLSVIMQVLLNNGFFKTTEIISQSAIDKMMTPTWQYDEKLKNGHTGGEALPDDKSAFGMMTTYGLSTHIIDLKDWGITNNSLKLYGHLGSAYGLQGQFWYDPLTKNGIIAFVTGLGDDPTKAEKTIPLLGIEEKVLKLGLKGLDIL